MTPEQSTAPDKSMQWLAVSTGQTTPADLRLYQRMSAEDTAQDSESGDAWFVGVTRQFAGCADPRVVLERVVTAWFAQSGLAPLVAQADADAQAITFWKALDVQDAGAVAWTDREACIATATNTGPIGANLDGNAPGNSRAAQQP